MENYQKENLTKAWAKEMRTYEGMRDGWLVKAAAATTEFDKERFAARAQWEQRSIDKYVKAIGELN